MEILPAKGGEQDQQREEWVGRKHGAQGGCEQFAEARRQDEKLVPIETEDQSQSGGYPSHKPEVALVDHLWSPQGNSFRRSRAFEQDCFLESSGVLPTDRSRQGSL